MMLPLEIGKLGRKESAIPLNVLPMAPHSGSFEVNHPRSPLWMFLSRIVVGSESSPRAPDTVDQREVKADQELRLALLFATSASRRLDGAIGGAQAGYNLLAGILLAGVEGDLNYSSQRAKLNAVCPGEICNPALIGVIGDPSVIARFEQGQKLEWFATLRGRFDSHQNLICHIVTSC